MASLHLVTGYKGTPHITSADQGVFNAYSIGSGDYVLTMGRMFEAQIINNNTVRIHSGCLLMNGRQVNLDSGLYMDASITNGTAGMKRHDIIVARYNKDNTTGVESASIAVCTGATATDTPADPEIDYDASILDGSFAHDMPLYRVVLEGLTIAKVEPLFRVLAPMADIQHGFYNQNLLINGDFQCNQRGNKTYEVTGSTQSAYSVDMWRIHKLKMEVLNEGVKLTGNSDDVGYLTQFIQLGKLKTTTYTISAMVDDKVCSFTVTPGGAAKEKSFGTFNISALTTSTWDNDLNDYNNKLKINICPIGTNTITIKYVDVFEGAVAYPHVKEDPATALIRCRRYVQRGCQICPVIRPTTGTSGLCSYRFGIPFDAMAKTPTLERCSWFYYTSESKYDSGDVSKLTVATTRTDGLIEVNTPEFAAYSSFVTGVRATYVVSCEHNPNGD